MTLIGFQHVELRVRNLQESANFFCSLFGLRRLEAVPPNEKLCTCEASEGAGFAVVLSEGLPEGTPLAGLDHIGVRVSTEQDVQDAYTKAKAMGLRATEPRVFDGAWQTFLFDPSGYKIEVSV